MVYFKTKIPIWVYFGGPWNGKCWYILRPFGIIYDHSVYVIYWYSLWSFGIFFLVLVCLDQEKSGNPGQKLSTGMLIMTRHFDARNELDVCIDF
jgi:hypothetical protein